MTLEALSRPSCTYGVVGTPTPKNLRPSINLNANAGNQGYNVQAGANFSNNKNSSVGLTAGVQGGWGGRPNASVGIQGTFRF
jgi:hypothetical protein